jgi:hypothetical protein
LILVRLCSLLLNKTHITLTNNSLIKWTEPIHFTGKKELALAEIADVFLDSDNNTQQLYLVLKDGSKVILIDRINDRESMMFIKRLLKEKIKHL